MKKIFLFLLVAFTFSTYVNAQSIGVSVDSVYVLRPYTPNPAGDTTEYITVTNLTASALDLKITLTYEDLSPGWALTEFFAGFPHQIVSNQGVGFTDSLTLAANDSFDIRTVFVTSPTPPLGRVKYTVYDPIDSINTYQILTFAAIQCDNPDRDVIIDPMGLYCTSDSVYLSADAIYSNYQWSNGDTSSIVYVPVTSVVTIEAEDSLGCLSEDTANINVSVPFEEEICIVSVDSITGNNIVVWEKTPNVGTEQFYIYKESFVAGVYNLIGFVPYDSLSVFVDVNSNPLQQAERYKITAVDSCGNESDLNMTTDHKTIHLTASIGTGNEHNLVWDGYEGFSFPTYNIYRGTTSNNMSLLAQVASSAFTYSDLTPLSGTNYYKVEAVRSSTCAPTQKTSSFPSSVSNQVQLNPVGVEEVLSENITVYPNPIERNININLGRQYSNLSVSIKNVLGATIFNKKFNSAEKITLDYSLNSGVYFIEINIDEIAVVTRKIIKR